MLTVINIILVFMRIIRVIHNKCPTKTITILRRQMTVVPEGTCLIGDIEVIPEGVPRGDGTLCDEGGAVCPRRPLLKETMPMLAM